MWFMYAIIEIYLIMPFLSRLLEKCNNLEAWLLVGIMILFYQFRETLTIVFNLDREYFLYKTGFDLLGPYVSYCIIGYLLAFKTKIPQIKLIILFEVILLIGAGAIKVVIEYSRGAWIPELNWYGLSLTIMVSSVALFLLLSNIRSSNIPKIILYLSKYSFGIYLSHYFFIFISKSVIEYMGWNFTISQTSYYMFGFSFISAFLLTIFLSKSKILKIFVM